MYRYTPDNYNKIHAMPNMYGICELNIEYLFIVVRTCMNNWTIKQLITYWFAFHDASWSMYPVYDSWFVQIMSINLYRCMSNKVMPCRQFIGTSWERYQSSRLFLRNATKFYKVIVYIYIIPQWHGILDSQNRYSMANMIHTPTKGTRCTKHELDHLLKSYGL